MVTSDSIENMGHLERRITPFPFAVYLVESVREYTGKRTVAALYVDMLGPYLSMPGVQAWPVFAQCYNGPHPVVAHPCCGPWGKLKWNCKHQSRKNGIDAMIAVHRFGGVVEQPSGSSLFREFGKQGAYIETVDQCHFGHRARKRTLLYFWM